MESVLHEFDTVIFEKATPDNVLALVDGTSLLWRLELMGIDAGEKRWERLTESCAKLIGSHGLAWLAELCVQQKNVRIPYLSSHSLNCNQSFLAAGN